MRNHEHLEQKALCEWLDWHGIGHAAIPNGGHRHPAVAAKLKAEGVKAGMPDLLLFPPHSSGAHVMIELKRMRKPGAPKGRLSTEQKSRIAELVQQNWIVIVAFGCDDAIKKLQALGY